jgi:hypothetical protein
MPYLECPGCRASLYSAARYSWITGRCSACGTSLAAPARHVPVDRGHESRDESQMGESRARLKLVR